MSDGVEDDVTHRARTYTPQVRPGLGSSTGSDVGGLPGGSLFKGNGLDGSDRLYDRTVNFIQLSVNISEKAMEGTLLALSPVASLVPMTRRPSTSMTPTVFTQTCFIQLLCAFRKMTAACTHLGVGKRRVLGGVDVEEVGL